MGGKGDPGFQDGGGSLARALHSGGGEPRLPPERIHTSAATVTANAACMMHGRGVTGRPSNG